MPVSYGGDNIAFADGTNIASGRTGFINRVINGDMRIDQRNAGASVTNTTSNLYTLDRFFIYGSQASKFTVQQNAGSVTPPAGFSNYLGVTSSSAYTVGASEEFGIYHRIEGFNTADLGWGTANAKTVTLSFWVRSSLTGTFGGSLNNSGNSRSYPFSYTISSANTWEQKSITVAGDITGTWVGATNGYGIQLVMDLGCGSTLQGTANTWAGAAYFAPTGATSVVGTNGATFYITGVDLRAGTYTTAPTWEFRSIGQELALCQRYYFRLTNDSGGAVNMTTFQVYGTGAAYGKLCDLPVTMRALPTGSLSAIGSFNPSNTAGANVAAFTSGNVDVINKNFLATGGFSGSNSLSAGNATNISIGNNAWIAASAEL